MDNINFCCSDMFMNALKYAYEKHFGQVRKDGTPYINHPVRVANFVQNFIFDYDIYDNKEDVIIAALLHDTLEDTIATYDELLTLFGKRVALLVKELTNDDVLKKELGKEYYLMVKVVSMSDVALFIKLCDRLDNVIDLVNSDYSFQLKYIKETINIINYLIDNRQLFNVHFTILRNILEMLLNINLVEENFSKINYLLDVIDDKELNVVKELNNIK